MFQNKFAGEYSK